jgi:hypothetical protein
MPRIVIILADQAGAGCKLEEISHLLCRSLVELRAVDDGDTAGNLAQHPLLLGRGDNDLVDDIRPRRRRLLRLAVLVVCDWNDLERLLSAGRASRRQYPGQQRRPPQRARDCIVRFHLRPPERCPILRKNIRPSGCADTPLRAT